MQSEENVFSNHNLASVGDVILFERNNHTYQGTVFLVRDNSVLVEISTQAAQILGYERPNTVVGHGKYTVCQSPEKQYIM